MPRSHHGFADRRRARKARLACKFDRLDQMEPRSLITDPISLAGLSMGLPAVWGLLGLTRASGLGGDSATSGLLAAQGGSQTPGQGSAMAVSQPQARSLAGDQTQLPLRIVPPARSEPKGSDSENGGFSVRAITIIDPPRIEIIDGMASM